MTKQIEIPQGTIGKEGYQTPTENINLRGEFTGFVPIAQAMLLCFPVVRLANIKQLINTLHLVSLLEFEGKLANLQAL